MKKLFIAGGIGLLLVAGGAFVYLDQQAKAAVKDLNANLPEGVKVEKSMLGNKYRVVNEIDGYDFNVPKYSWNELQQVIYKDAISEEISYGVEFEADLNDSIVSEKVLGIQQEENGWDTTLEIRRMQFGRRVEPRAFVEALKGSEVSFYKTALPTLTIDFNEEFLSLGEHSVVRLQSFSRRVEDREVTSPQSYYIFQSGEYTYFFINDGTSEGLLRDIIISGNW